MEHFVEGWTTPIDYQLKKGPEAGPLAPFNAAGMAVSLELRDRSGVVITETGSTEWLDAAQSQVRYTPAAADLTFARSPIRARFKVVAGADVAFFPRGEAEDWVIHRP